jgi:anhydro-N-acetylmuramic acid kinase
MDFLQKQLKGNLHLPSVGIIEFKEALIFGFLGVLRLLGHPNCLASVTGVSADHSAGEVYFP